jgi:hypothetical protein
MIYLMIGQLFYHSSIETQNDEVSCRKPRSQKKHKPKRT